MESLANSLYYTLEDFDMQQRQKLSVQMTRLVFLVFISENFSFQLVVVAESSINRSTQIFDNLTRGGPQNGRLGNILRKKYLGLWLKLINDTSTCSKTLLELSRKYKINFEKLF